MISDLRVLSSPGVQAQHLVDVTKWMRSFDMEISGLHQMHVAHQTDEKLAEVEVEWHAHGKATAL